MLDQTSFKTHLIEVTLQAEELRGGVHLYNGASLHHNHPEERDRTMSQ